MDLALFIVIIGVVASNVVVLFLLRRAYHREKDAFIATLRLYFEPQEENGLSQFGALVESISERLAQRMVSSFKSSFMGMQSVDSKNLARLQGDVVQDDAAASSPMLGALLSQYPSVAKRLAKNPELLPLVQGLLHKVSAGKNNHPGAGRQSSFESDLNKWR